MAYNKCVQLDAVNGMPELGCKDLLYSTYWKVVSFSELVQLQLNRQRLLIARSVKAHLTPQSALRHLRS